MKKNKIAGTNGKKIARTLISAIKKSKLSQAEVFRRAGLSRMNVRSWKIGLAEPTLPSMRKVEKALRICARCARV